MATSRDYLPIPSATAGVFGTTPISAWGYSAYMTITEGIAGKIYITGVTFMPDVTDASLALDTTCEVLIELYKGTGDTLIAQIPFSYRIDTRVNHVLPCFIDLQEPLEVEANTRIRFRVADSVAAVMDTGSKGHEAVKIMYYINRPPTCVAHTES